MFLRNTSKVLVLVSLVLLIAFSAASRPRKMQRLSPGPWGGQHIGINIEGSSARVDFDCANGTIKGPLTIDSKGRFSWPGVYNREHGGPVRMDEQSDGRPAIYSGSIKDGTMTLSLKLADTNEAVESYTLKRGSTGRIRKCM